ncbi:MAG: NAD(P)-binding domain-containing protein [Pseudolabrys sp.]|nr:NAD(P)-binding domain-containing protein [Pseudolabrys sp.]
MNNDLPIAVIGAGPVGLAAAAHLVGRGIAVRVYEAGETAGAHVRDWGHVRVFSPWRYNIDSAARDILLKHGWQEPDGDGLPTGEELYAQYLRPLAETPDLRRVIETGARVRAVSRQGIDKVSSRQRESHPFVLTVATAQGERIDLARAVIDASGTWSQPNPMGATGLPAIGEDKCGDVIAYGIPDILGRDRARYAGQRVLVVGAGHSAANALLDLARLAESDTALRLTWVVRGRDLTRVFGGGAADQLPARGRLGTELKRLVDSGRLTLVTGFAVERIARDRDGVTVSGSTADGPRALAPVDRIVVATGQRPDLGMVRELRLDLDPWLESPRALGPMIDPNLHSCGSVPPHGHRELSHPEPGYYAVGIKSYGRAPTFLMATGYEQVRSIAAQLAGDTVAADDVRLVLPETGVCSADPVITGESAGCCGGPAPAGVDACCSDDAAAKSEGKAGCGCSSAAPSATVAKASCCGSAKADRVVETENA